ncbi:MAG: hypothetical protein CVU65_15380 [Deltaproteobacteria bacterium HGW-Deltaproteobacteria-22]|nr:MAG: hypothetical protein CVU65_15380 [Deltaproteobacteria bacterium HGW-Deltaproteobacteria-22]
MDLKVHRAILLLALQRVKQRIDPNKLIIPPDELLNKTFYPLWHGNWLTDMNQASAFFDVLENKYQDPYTRWRGSGTYDFPQVIRDHQTEWVNLFNTLWAKEYNEVAQFPAFKAIKPPAPQLKVTDPNQIGGYYPYDHFDVADRMRPLCPQCNGPMSMTADQNNWRCTDQQHAPLQAGAEGNVQWEPVPDSVEFENAQDKLSHTIHRGVFTECLWGPLNTALVGQRDHVDNLRILGKALHTLQDLFAHSNFVELLLLCGDSRGLLPTALSEALKAERVGSYAAYACDSSVDNTIVVPGRFDQMDTVASILKIYRENLVTRWEDLETGGYDGHAGRTRDLMVEVLFGTFSNQPFAPSALAAVKAATGVSNFIASVGDSIKSGAVRFFAWVAQKLTDDQRARAAISEVEGLLLAANDAKAKDYANAGRIMYLEHVISKRLEEKLRNDRLVYGCEVLPHHTLLAKDQDVSHPECRLGFKLASLLAVDLTAQILEQYLTGGDLTAIEKVLRARIVHPARLLDNTASAKALKDLIPTIYGERWWHAGNKPIDLILR